MMSYRDIIGEKIRAAAMSKITQRSRFARPDKRLMSQFLKRKHSLPMFAIAV